MRWIVTGLLLANVVFLLWNWLQYSHERDVQAMNASVGGHLVDMPGARLVLLREGGGGAAAAPPSLGLLPAQPVENTAAVTAEKKKSEAAPLVAPIDEIVSAEGEGMPPPANAVAPEGAALGADLCVLLGPVADDAVAKVVVERLAALQISAAHASVEVAGVPDYWVYLKPEATRELATVRLRELQEKKIDSFIIPQGEMANGISLGVFDKKENAERRQQVIKERGYDALIRENPRIYREKWVALQPAEAVKFSPELYQQLRADHPLLDLRKEQCGKVASVGEFH